MRIFGVLFWFPYTDSEIDESKIDENDDDDEENDE